MKIIGCAAAQANLERVRASALLRLMVDVFFMYISFSRREDGAILSACALRREGDTRTRYTDPFPTGV
jgi:hypothetical protein